MKTTKYVRLLSYENAIKVIDFCDACGHYAHITTGGVAIELDDTSELEAMLQKLKVRFEITSTHPTKVEQEIINNSI